MHACITKTRKSSAQVSRMSVVTCERARLVTFADSANHGCTLSLGRLPDLFSLLEVLVVPEVRLICVANVLLMCC